MSTTSSNQDLNQFLTTEGAQGFIAENKNLVVGIVVLIVLAALGFGLYLTLAENSKAEFNAKIHQFETTTLAPFSTHSLEAGKAKELETAFLSLHNEIGNYKGLLPVGLQTVDALMAAGYMGEAKKLLDKVEQTAKNAYAKYFVYSRQAVVFENLGETDEAIKVLERMTSHSVRIFEGKTYLDLGRLYLAKGDTEKAKRNFTHVVEQAKGEAEFVKIAQLYLSKM